MHKNSLFLIFLILFVSFLRGKAQTIQGKVLEQTTNKPLHGAIVYLHDLKTGVLTDSNGVFILKKFKPKRLHLQIIYTGYKTLDTTLSLQSKSELVFHLQKLHIDLQEVTISTTASKTSEDNIVSVERKKINELQASAPLTLSEAIASMNGVSQITTGTGIGKPVIRGLSGARIVTYALGMRMENQQWGEEHGLGVGAPGIESVELIKGPASLLYGADAIGGVLIFSEEKYALPNSIETSLYSDFHSNTQGINTQIGIKVNKKGIKWNAFAGLSSFADYQIPNGKYVFNSRFQEKNFKFSYGFSLGNWFSNIRYAYLQNLPGIVEDSLFAPRQERTFVIPFQKIETHIISSENILFTGNSKWELTLGYSDNYRREFEESNSYPSVGLDLQTFFYNIKWYSPKYQKHFDYVFGIQGMHKKNTNTGTEILIPDAQTTDAGIFGLMNIYWRNVRLQGGIRADLRKMLTSEMQEDTLIIPSFGNSYRGLSFSFGALYTGSNTTIRFNISNGFRAPNSIELLADGIHYGGNRYLTGNTSLTTENALQLDLFGEKKFAHWSFFLNPFYNFIRNYIYLAPQASVINGYPLWKYEQADVFLTGGEGGFHIHPHIFHGLHWESSFAWVIAGKKQTNEPLPMIPQPSIKNSLSLTIEKGKKIQWQKIYITHLYKFPQNRVSLPESPVPAYHLIHIGTAFLTKVFSVPVEIKTGVHNLFNTRYIDNLSRLKWDGVPAPGRNFFVGINLKINKR